MLIYQIAKKVLWCRYLCFRKGLIWPVRFLLQQFLKGFCWWLLKNQITWLNPQNSTKSLHSWLSYMWVSLFYCLHDAGLRRGTLSKRWRMLGWREERGCHGNDNDTGRHMHSRLPVLLGENFAQSTSTGSWRTSQHRDSHRRLGPRLCCSHLRRSRWFVVISGWPPTWKTWKMWELKSGLDLEICVLLFCGYDYWCSMVAFVIRRKRVLWIVFFSMLFIILIFYFITIVLLHFLKSWLHILAILWSMDRTICCPHYCRWKGRESWGFCFGLQSGHPVISIDLLVDVAVWC